MFLVLYYAEKAWYLIIFSNPYLFCFVTVALTPIHVNDLFCNWLPCIVVHSEPEKLQIPLYCCEWVGLH